MKGRESLPCLAMVLVQLGYAGMNVLSKLAMDSGMNPFVMATYRQVFATVVLGPFAYFFEWKMMPKITKSVLIQLLLSSVLGATLNQCLYFLGLKHSTPTIACALTNLLPALTFLMAIPFGMETVGIKRRAGQAKVIGTILCVGGAMLMSFYKGRLIKIGKSPIDWRYAESMRERNSGNEESTFIGPLLIVGSCVAWAGWFIVQTKMSKGFPAPYTSSGIMSLMAAVQCSVIGAFAERDLKEWSLHSNIRLVASAYSGAIGSALAFCLMSWCIQRKGPLYVSMFSPLLLVIVAILGWGLLDEKIYVGSVVGSALIVLGLYAVLWGKEQELEAISGVDDDKTLQQIEGDEKSDLELQVSSNKPIQDSV
ncbi:hypothetical protein Sjap_007006 [Stephania japonica]|uniref:WAT1-related protein n=1 Tax=Stephania japonica TaxID=461633 RepID=A0AAP0K6W9_9MAGN